MAASWSTALLWTTWASAVSFCVIKEFTDEDTLLCTGGFRHVGGRGVEIGGRILIVTIDETTDGSPTMTVTGAKASFSFPLPEDARLVFAQYSSTNPLAIGDSVLTTIDLLEPGTGLILQRRNRLVDHPAVSARFAPSMRDIHSTQEKAA
jgi:hypothetical protein